MRSLNRGDGWPGAVAIGVLLGAVVFAMLGTWGLFDYWRLGWCSVNSCPEFLDVLGHALACAAVAAAIATVWIGIRFAGTVKLSSPIKIALMYAVAVVAAYPGVLAVRERIAEAYFPYVTSLRFGALGFFIVWVTSCLVLIWLITRFARKSQRQSG